MGLVKNNRTSWSEGGYFLCENLSARYIINLINAIKIDIAPKIIIVISNADIASPPFLGD